MGLVLSSSTHVGGYICGFVSVAAEVDGAVPHTMASFERALGTSTTYLRSCLLCYLFVIVDCASFSIRVQKLYINTFFLRLLDVVLAVEPPIL